MDRQRLTRAAAVAATVSALLGAATESVAAEIVLSRLGEERDHIVVMGRDGRDRRRISSELQAFSPVWSPGGSRIAYWGSRTYDAGFDEVTVVSLSGRKRRITGFGWRYPSWSPDGRWIAAACERVGPCERRPGLYLVDPDRPRRKKRIRRTGDAEVSSWAPGGKRIAFVRDFHGRGELYVKRLGAPRLRRLTRSGVDEAGPDWSPDGRWIVYSRPPRYPQQPHELWLVSPDGERLRRVTETRANESNPAWSPSGRRILFSTGRGLFSIRPDGTHRRKIRGSKPGDCCADW